MQLKINAGQAKELAASANSTEVRKADLVEMVSAAISGAARKGNTSAMYYLRGDEIEFKEEILESLRSQGFEVEFSDVNLKNPALKISF